jgi:hypothetical protein
MLILYCHLSAIMKNYKYLSLAILAVVVMLYAGIDGIINQYSYGPFVTFVGGCTAVGVAIDLIQHVQLSLRKSNVRKLRP